MATNVSGNAARLFPTQTKHYYQRGGPNDPVAQSAFVAGHWTGGSLSWNSSLSLPPISQPLTPPGQAAPRVQSLNSGGTLAANVLGTNNGGILIGTIPGGSWIDEVEIFCYEAFAGGTSTSFGLFWAPANTINTANLPGMQPASLFTLGYITTPVASTLYGTRTRPAGGATLTAALTAYNVGPGVPATPAVVTTLASNGPPEGQGFAGLAQAQASGGAVPTPASGDIDIYAVAFLVAGNGVAPTQGSFSARVDFTGQEG